jgi:hypothetical protein
VTPIEKEEMDIEMEEEEAAKALAELEAKLQKIKEQKEALAKKKKEEEKKQLDAKTLVSEWLSLTIQINKVDQLISKGKEIYEEKIYIASEFAYAISEFAVECVIEKEQKLKEYEERWAMEKEEADMKRYLSREKDLIEYQRKMWQESERKREEQKSFMERIEEVAQDSDMQSELPRNEDGPVTYINTLSSAPTIPAALFDALASHIHRDVRFAGLPEMSSFESSDAESFGTFEQRLLALYNEKNNESLVSSLPSGTFLDYATDSEESAMEYNIAEDSVESAPTKLHFHKAGKRARRRREIQEMREEPLSMIDGGVEINKPISNGASFASKCDTEELKKEFCTKPLVRPELKAKIESVVDEVVGKKVAAAVDSAITDDVRE